MIYTSVTNDTLRLGRVEARTTSKNIVERNSCAITEIVPDIKAEALLSLVGSDIVKENKKYFSHMSSIVVLTM